MFKSHKVKVDALHAEPGWDEKLPFPSAEFAVVADPAGGQGAYMLARRYFKCTSCNKKGSKACKLAMCKACCTRETTADSNKTCSTHKVVVPSAAQLPVAGQVAAQSADDSSRQLRLAAEEKKDKERQQQLAYLHQNRELEEKRREVAVREQGVAEHEALRAQLYDVFAEREAKLLAAERDLAERSQREANSAVEEQRRLKEREQRLEEERKKEAKDRAEQLRELQALKKLVQKSGNVSSMLPTCTDG
jgi:hypothetical protein